MTSTIKVGDSVTLHIFPHQISGCRVLQLKDGRALLQKPRGDEEEWVSVNHLVVEDVD